MQKESDKTMKFDVLREDGGEYRKILQTVYKALEEKGYNPVNQIVGYLLSGDPAYITSHNNARNLIRRLERDELLEKMVTTFLDNNM